MKVTTTDLTHNIVFVPRYTPAVLIVVELYNETTKVVTVVDNTYAFVDGKMDVLITFTFAENDKYQIKISDEDGILYRGKIMATIQTPQDFKATNELYYYE
jgi:hypothetical protein